MSNSTEEPLLMSNSTEEPLVTSNKAVLFNCPDDNGAHADIELTTSTNMNALK